MLNTSSLLDERCVGCKPATPMVAVCTSQTHLPVDAAKLRRLPKPTLRLAGFTAVPGVPSGVPLPGPGQRAPRRGTALPPAAMPWSAGVPPVLRGPTRLGGRLPRPAVPGRQPLKGGLPPPGRAPTAGGTELLAIGDGVTQLPGPTAIGVANYVRTCNNRVNWGT
jgi:hypothetical protein